jgi:hypothetical protein
MSLRASVGSADASDEVTSPLAAFLYVCHLRLVNGYAERPSDLGRRV